MAYRILSFAGVTIQNHLGSAGQMDIGGGHSTSRPGITGAGIVHHPLITLPGGYVYDPIGFNVAVRSSIDLSAKIMLLPAPMGPSSIKTQLDQWLALQGSRGTLILQGDDATTKSASARLVSVDAIKGYNNRSQQPIELTWTVTGLPWAGNLNTYNIVQTTSGIGVVTFILNNGNVTVTNPVFSITAVTGPITRFSFAEFLSPGSGGVWTGVVAVGTTLTIDCGSRTVLNNGVDAYSGFVGPTSFENWLTVHGIAIRAVTNATYTGTPPTTTITYNDAWA